MKNGKLAHLSTFASDRRGNFAVMGAVALFPMLMVAGMAMDTGRAFSEKTRLEDALDAAVLSAGRAYSTGRIAESDLKDYLTRILHANFHDKDGTGGTRRIEDYNLDEENGIIFASAISDFEIAFKIIGGGEPLELKASSAASFGGTNAEVAFTLDVTGSMGAGKNKDLQEALTGAIDLLLAANGDGEERIRISLIPYSKSVRVGEFLSDYIYIDDGTPGAVAPAHVSVPDDDESASAGGSGDGLEDGAEVDSTSEINSKYIGCATERKKDIDNPTDNGPDYGMVNLDGRVLEFGATAIFVVNCPSEAETMVPLTSDRDTLMTTADSLGHRGSTAGHVGIQWAWYTLSPKWASYMPDGAGASEYNSATEKYAVIMTDGLFNIAYSKSTAINGNAASKDVKKITKNYCDNMKGTGIKIFTVGFDIPETGKAFDILADCASPDEDGVQYFYLASDGDELKSIYLRIAAAIQKLHLVN